MSSQVGFGKRGVVSSPARKLFGQNQLVTAGGPETIGSGNARNAQDAVGTAGSGETISSTEMHFFVGKNWHKFESAFEDWSRGKPGLSWCWPGFFIPTVWLLYRKMYMEFGLLVLLATVLEYVVGNMGLVLGLVMALQGKALYFMHAKRKILAIRDRSASPEEAAIMMSEAGRTSTAGAIIGCLLFVVGIFALVASSSATM